MFYVVDELAVFSKLLSYFDSSGLAVWWPMCKAERP